jgi:hypothetical protein
MTSASHDESIGRALIAGALAALVGGAVWALLVLVAHIEIGWIAWGIGLLVGLAMGRLTPVRGQAVAVLAALLAGLGLVAGKSLIVAVGARPGLADGILEDSSLMAQATVHELRIQKTLPPDIQQKLQALPYGDTLPDDLWGEMVAAGAAHVATLDETERERIATEYAELFVGQMGFFQMLKGQMSPWDFLWFGLAVATAFKMMSAAPAPKASTEAG